MAVSDLWLIQIRVFTSSDFDKWRTSRMEWNGMQAMLLTDSFFNDRPIFITITNNSKLHVRFQWKIRFPSCCLTPESSGIEIKSTIYFGPVSV